MRNNDGPYRVTTVTMDGFPVTRKIKRWSDARMAWYAAQKWARYAVIVELSEDPNFHDAREEWKRP